MKIDDLVQVMVIEQASFKDPWKRSFFEYDLKQKDGHCYIAKENKQIVGYIVAWHIIDEMHLANIAVATSYRHKGIGCQLLSRVINIAQKNKCKKIFLEVRISNTIAQKFYEKFGFCPIYQRKKYYPDGEEAIVYVKSI